MQQVRQLTAENRLLKSRVNIFVFLIFEEKKLFLIQLESDVERSDIIRLQRE
jgi:hypothetical protein